GGSSVAENDQLSALTQALVNGARRVDNLFGFITSHASPQIRVFLGLGSDRVRDLLDNVAGVLLLFSEKWVEEPGVADVIAEFAMLEKDVNGLPQRVIQDLHQLLMDERISRRRLQRVRTAAAWERESHGSTFIRGSERGRDFGFALRRSESHDDIFWPE